MSNNKIKCLLFLMSFFGCTEIPDELRDDAESDGRCGIYIYNPSASFCHDGNVYAKCDGLRYNPATQICQGTTVVATICGGSQYNPLEQGCCVSATFSLANQRCQNNVVETRCGTGNNYYNPETQFCYQDLDYNILNKCSGKEYDPDKYSWFNAEQRCMNNVVETRCGGDWYALDSNQQCDRFGKIIATKCGNYWYCSYYSNLRCQNNVVEIKCENNWYNSATHYCKNSTTPTQYGSLEYAGQTYRTVIIGEQVWMAENLNYYASGSRCYNDKETNCTTYGRLYNWAAAMGIDAKYNSEKWNESDVKHRGVCPSGWHLPSNAEWKTLTSYVESSSGCSYCASKHLKSRHHYSGWIASNGVDTYGFAALPGGFGDSEGNFKDANWMGYWWTDERWNNLVGGAVDYSFSGISDYNKSSFLSVRCLQD